MSKEVTNYKSGDLPRWKSSNYISLTSKTEKFIEVQNKPYLFISQNNTLYCFEICPKENTFNKYIQIEIDDNIVNYHVLDDFRIVIIGKEKKFIYFYDKEKLMTKCEHIKKITDSYTYHSNGNYYLVYADKFGEIYLKILSQSQFNDEPLILYGHTDTVLFLKLSPDTTRIASSDNFGKLKICEFPNIFNVLTVICYKINEVIYTDFLNKDILVVLTNEFVVHFWSVEKLEIITKYNITHKDVKSVYLLSTRIIIEDKNGSLECINCIDLMNITEEVKEFETTDGNNLLYESKEGKEVMLLKYDKELKNVVSEKIKFN